MKKTSNILFSLFLLGSTNLALADTTSANFQVSAEATPYCILQTATIAFTSSNMLDGPRSAGMINHITCTKGVSYSLKVDGGLNYDGTNRFMTSTSSPDKLQYALYYNASTPAPVNVAILNTTGSGIQQSFAISAKQPAKQNVAAGLYNDTVTVTIDY
jgi:spore coat protein U-like protein